MEIDAMLKKEAINAFQLKRPNLYRKEEWITLPILEENLTVKKYILKRTSCFDKRLLASFKLVNLDNALLERKLMDLSSSEKIKVELAIHLILNDSILYLYKFDTYFMEKDLLFFKKFFKKLVTKYHKTICFLNCKPTFLVDFAEKFGIEKTKGKFIEIEKPTFYEKELESLIEEPKIIEFVKYINEDGKKVNQYVDLKELLKAIFREV